MITRARQAIRLLDRLRRARRAAAAIEFALVLPVFLMFSGMIMENGLLLFDQAFLDFATADASRLIRTGQVQTGSGETAFTNQLCADLSPLIACSGLQVNVAAASNPGFGSLSASLATDANGNLTTTDFTPGGPGDDVLVQVAYKRDYLIPWVGRAASASGMALIFSTTAFQNEKYTGP